MGLLAEVNEWDVSGEWEEMGDFFEITVSPCSRN
jgi:hypothetical protein